MDSNTNKTLTNSKDIKWSEIEPTVFTDLPEVVKDLGLEEQGAKLMDEQNRMIILKHDLQTTLTGAGDAFPSNDSASDPFDFSANENPNIGMYRREKMKKALKLSALYNQQYRVCAMDFLDALIPRAKRERNNLQHDIDLLELELESLKADYAKRIREKKKELNKLLSGCIEVSERFKKTDTGTAANGGHVPCERPEGIYYGRISFGRNNAIDNLVGIRAEIDRIEHPFKDEPSIDSNYKSAVQASFLGGFLMR